MSGIKRSDAFKCQRKVLVHSELLTGREARLAMVEGTYACLSKAPNTAQLLETIASVSSTT